VPITLDLVIRAAANRVAAGDKVLREDCDRVRLGVGRERLHHVARQPVEGGRIEDRP
jgi:hypothetical protein